MRDNMPFGRVGTGEFGTYFIGYCRTPRVTEQMTENMFVGRPPDNYDRLLQPRGDRSPVLRTIRDIPGIRERHRRCGGDARCGINTRARTIYGPGKEKTGMNNLHRELAPISDAAWADIEEETTRTLRYLAGRRVVDVHGPGGVGLLP